MLAANDIVVSLVGNRVTLALDGDGVAITNLSTSYQNTSGVLTITAATAGNISGSVPGITIDNNTDTIAVNLKTVTKFAGISIVGLGGTDSIRIGRGGVNLGGVVRGAAAQGLSIDTGTGSDDTIAITGPVITKGAGAVNLATQGRPALHGILVAAGLSTPGGGQTFAGAVTLLGDVAIRAGGDVSFSSTVDGSGRLHLAAGRAITLAGDVGGMLPLAGLTLATASRVTVGRGLSLDGSGTALGTSGLVVGANVHNVVFSPTAAARTISGFSGAGIRFQGGSERSLIAGVASTGNGIGIQLGPGSYARTSMVGSSFSGNSSAGVSLASARGVTIGGTAPGAGNTIVSNGRFGVTASGMCMGSLVLGNEIGDNALGQVENFLASSLAGNTITQNATWLRFQLTDVGRAAYRAQKARTYTFDVTFEAFAVSARSTGWLDTRSGSLNIDASVGFETSPSPTPPTLVPQPAVLGSNRVVSGLTPLKTLPGIEFPKRAVFVGSEAGGKRYRAEVGLSTFAGILPLADLDGAPITSREDSPVAVDVWVNAQGLVSRVGGSFDGGSFDVVLRDFGRPGSALPGGMWLTFPPPVSQGSITPVAALPLAAGPLLPGTPNGVTGVQAGHATLSIPYGAGYQAPADWYFPTQADGTVDAQGVIWLQHASGATSDAYSELAGQLARQTNSIVVAPTLPSNAAAANNPGWWIPGDAMAQSVASLFQGSRSALRASAAAAGYTGDQGELSGKFSLVGHSAGGGFATAVAAEYATSHADATNLVGVVMYDGVSAGAIDGSGRFAQHIAALDARAIPVYQLAAPAQLWNAYGATTNALLAARPNRFSGVVLAGGSHVDAMLGGDPGVDFVAQRVTKLSSPGNAAAVQTLGAGWINDLYRGATPDNPAFGFYAAADEPLVMGGTAAFGLPSLVANTLSRGDSRLDAEINAIGGLSGFQPGPAINLGTNGLSATVAPPFTNGVSGVKAGTAALTIPCGTSGYTTTADWFFPTQADGRVAANAVVWLQHGDRGDASSLATLATQIAQQTNSIVVAPTIGSFAAPGFPAGFMGSAAMREGVASMFRGGRGALTVSANAAGHRGLLPAKFLFTGYDAGGGFAASAAARAVDNVPAANLLGVVMFDGVADPSEFAASLAKLTSFGVPVYQIAAPAQAANAWGVTTAQLAALLPDQFVGIQIDNASHDDFIRGARHAGQGGGSATSLKEAQDAVVVLAVGWINDLYTGYGPTNPYYGIYSNPNDGTYVLGQPITMGKVRATVLPLLPTP